MEATSMALRTMINFIGSKKNPVPIYVTKEFC